MLTGDLTQPILGTGECWRGLSHGALTPGWPSVQLAMAGRGACPPRRTLTERQNTNLYPEG